ncbi:DNA (cytosine-5)-methyltransferase [Trifolium repens]|nr:DNA (cytosine-5)-methyltransferase [Trifolium repens]
MHSLVTAKREAIVFGGLITTIAKALGLGPRLVNLAHIPPCLIVEDKVRSMNLVRARRDDKYDLMIKNHVFNGITLPNPRRTDVRNEHNFCYTNDLVTVRAPTHISQNVAACGGANFVPPTHTPHFSNTFACSSSSS